MISLKDVMFTTRLILGDTGKTRYSDEELTGAVRAAAHLLADGFERHSCAEGIGRALLNGERVSLPSDFRGVVSVCRNGAELKPCLDGVGDGWKLDDETLSGVVTGAKLTYWRELFDWEDEALRLSPRYEVPVARGAALLLSGKWDEAEAMLDQSALKGKQAGIGTLDWTPPMWGG